MSKHKLIVLEGLDYSGKTTLANALAENLPSEDFQFFHEPHGKLGDFIRENGADLDSVAKALLFASARREFVANVLKPALETHNVVLDRFVASTLAYQIAGDNQDEDMIGQLLVWSNDLTPDVTIFIDIDPLEMQRRKSSREQHDKLDDYDTLYYSRVSKAYVPAICSTSHELAILDGKITRTETFEIAYDLIRKLVYENAS